MTKNEKYRQELAALANWDEFLLAESGLPGPRGNLELAQVVADLGNLDLFTRYLTYDADLAPTNSPYEFLSFCGTVGLGRLAAQGNHGLLVRLRRCANDRRWRMREAVAMALQRLGDADMQFLIQEMQTWSTGTLLEKRAAAAALCEPRLLKKPQEARIVLQILDTITASLLRVENRKDEDFIALRKGLGYCWSVAAASFPDEGLAIMEKWFTDPDGDIRWIMKENLKKARLFRVAPQWVELWTSRLDK